jgi:hypothetical protein
VIHGPGDNRLIGNRKGNCPTLDILIVKQNTPRLERMVTPWNFTLIKQLHSKSSKVFARCKAIDSRQPSTNISTRTLQRENVNNMLKINAGIF